MKNKEEVFQIIPDYLIPLNDMEESEWEKEFSIYFQVEILEEEGDWMQPPVSEMKYTSHQCYEDGKEVEDWEWLTGDVLNEIFETIDKEEILN